MDSSPRQICTALAALGVVSHVGYFIRGEHQLEGPRLFVTLVTAPLLSTGWLIYAHHRTFVEASGLTALYLLSFFIPFTISVAIYRAFFHPLRKFPGPPLARVTAWHHVSQAAPGNHHFRQLHKMHEQYGEYVRVSPKVISVANPDLVEKVHGYQTGFNKSEWYDVGQPMTTLHQMRDRGLHDRRRRHGWDKAFTSKSLRCYDNRIIKYTDILTRQMHQRAGEKVNMTDWMNWFAFDVMGDLAFGRAFNVTEEGKPHWFVELLHEQAKPVGAAMLVPWIIHLAAQLPAWINPMTKMLEYSLECVDERMAREPDEPDVMSHIIEAGPFFEDPVLERLLLMGDSRLIIVAGSDTTATTLVYIAYYLATQPAVAKKLRAEFTEHQIANDDSFSIAGLAHLGYLNGIINEALRLHPPVPGGLLRDTPADGLQVGDVYIPPNTTVVTPMYTIQRSPRAFVKPNDFIPERWSTQPELILNKEAWFPFNIGRYGCIGKQLALNELRTVVTKLVLDFDITLAPGETGYDLMEKSKDIFTMSNSKLDCVLHPRIVSPT